MIAKMGVWSYGFVEVQRPVSAVLSILCLPTPSGLPPSFLRGNLRSRLLWDWPNQTRPWAEPGAPCGIGGLILFHSHILTAAWMVRQCCTRPSCETTNSFNGVSMS
jgi:hypothetical protein